MATKKTNGKKASEKSTNNKEEKKMTDKKKTVTKMSKGDRKSFDRAFQYTKDAANLLEAAATELSDAEHSKLVKTRESLIKKLNTLKTFIKKNDPAKKKEREAEQAKNNMKKTIMKINEKGEKLGMSKEDIQNLIAEILDEELNQEEEID